MPFLWAFGALMILGGVHRDVYAAVIIGLVVLIGLALWKYVRP